MAEFERALSRTQAGIQRARDNGKTFGRKPKLNAKQRQILAQRYGRGETPAALAEEFKIGEATFWRALRAAA